MITVTLGRDRERFSINSTHHLTLTFSYDLILPFFGSSPCILTTSKRLFQTITDQRQEAKVTYCLFEVLFGCLCAVIAGAKGWFDIREYILGHHDWFKNNNLFVSGIPVDDTIARIISTIEPEQFHQCFINFMMNSVKHAVADNGDYIPSAIYID